MTHVGLVTLGYAILAQSAVGQPSAGGSSEHVIWAVVFIGMAIALFFAELFVPSGGLIGIASALCLIAGIVFLFWFDTKIGLIGSIVSVIAVPFAFAGALWVWPSTPIGRALTLGGDEDPDESNLDGQAPPGIATHEASIPVGTEGRTLTELRPVGTCLLDGKRQECLSASGVIDADVRVKVVAADGMQIKVQPV